MVLPASNRLLEPSGPMTMRPSKGMPISASSITPWPASRVPALSPRPSQRPTDSAAASVARSNSRPRFRPRIIRSAAGTPRAAVLIGNQRTPLDDPDELLTGDGRADQGDREGRRVDRHHRGYRVALGRDRAVEETVGRS